MTEYNYRRTQPLIHAHLLIVAHLVLLNRQLPALLLLLLNNHLILIAAILG